MWFKGTNYGVGLWYVCWGLKGKSFNVELYQTLTGLVKWVIDRTYREVPVFRIGRMLITEAGPEEKEHWLGRAEFLKWAKPLVGFKIPEL